jgi:hypothetical protein
MADTGAPWLIPYAEPADLVRDWPALSEDVAEAVADGLTAVLAGGIGTNVVQTVKTDTFTTTSTSFVDITNLEVTITPTTATSKVLLIASLAVGSRSQKAFVRFTGGNTSGYIGDSSGTLIRTTGESNAGNGAAQSVNLVYLDSPGTASAVTYKVQIRGGAGSNNDALINRQLDETTSNPARLASSLTAIEVAA